MSQPPSQQTSPDALVHAYRLASAQQRSGPNERVRAAILARAKQSGAPQDHAASGHDAAKRSFASAPPAANDARWKWKLAASLAGVSLAGMLAWQTYIALPQGAAPTAPGSSTDRAAPGGEMAPATASAHGPASAALPPGPSPAQPTAAPATLSAALRARPVAVPELASRESASGAAAAAADANRADAPRAALQSMNAKAAGAAAPAAFALAARREQVTAALRATFPELFAGPGETRTVRIAMVLNADGTIYKIARQQPAAADQADASSQLKQTLGIGADELAAPAQLMTIDRSAHQPNTIAVAVGVRGSER